MTTPTPTPDEADRNEARNPPGGSARGEFWRHALVAVMLIGVVGYIMFGENKGAGIFAALIVMVLTRLLILGTGEPSREGRERGR